MNKEENLLFTKDHEWVSLDAAQQVATVGISNHAQSSLGDIVFVDMPKLGISVKKNEAVSSVESVKTTSDIFAPLSGDIIEVNEALNQTPEKMNDAPYDAWIFKMKVSDTEEIKTLLSFEDYTKII